MKPNDLFNRLAAGYDYDPMYGELCNERDALQAENAKLRELARADHGPNTNHSGWMLGRHWAVMFRCTRCKRVETVEYRREGNDGNLQCQQIPDTWVSRGDMLLCPDCAVSFSDWMEAGR